MVWHGMALHCIALHAIIAMMRACIMYEGDRE